MRPTSVTALSLLLVVSGSALADSINVHGQLARLVPAQDATPPAAAPADAPPPPPPEAAPAEAAPEAQAAADQAQADGQWLYTDQYGWIWAPYGDQYSSIPSSEDSDPYEYCYEPNYGWTWLAAPWIFGWGPWPYFGYGGVARFGWYGRYWSGGNLSGHRGSGAGRPGANRGGSVHGVPPPPRHSSEGGHGSENAGGHGIGSGHGGGGHR